MQKSYLILILAAAGATFSLTATPAWACEGEAQIIAQVATTSFDPSRGCIGTLTNIENFSSNPFCALSIDDINAIGVNLSAVDSHSCAALVGSPLSGVVVKKNGVLTIE